MQGLDEELALLAVPPKVPISSIIQVSVGGWYGHVARIIRGDSNLRSTIDLQNATNSTQPTVHKQRYTTNSKQPAVHKQQYTNNSTQSTVHNQQYTVNSTQPTVHSKQYTTNSTQTTVNN